MSNPFPDAIGRLLELHHAGGVTDADCCACSSPCCSLGGFAILENVVEIYALYRRGGLRRRDYEFAPALSFEEFVFTYFEVYRKRVPLADGREPTLLLFHMRALSSDGHLISIPAVGDYWETRAALFDQNPWLNHGCVFLSHRVPSWPGDDRDASRHCILHAADSGTAITTKPIDCVFYTCNTPIDPRVPDADRTAAWFRLLAEHYPDSLERFEALLGDSAGDAGPERAR
jgi:hypothetical protein